MLLPKTVTVPLRLKHHTKIRNNCSFPTTEILNFKSIFLRFLFKLFTQGDFMKDFPLVFPLLRDNALLMLAARLFILLACQKFSVHPLN